MLPSAAHLGGSIQRTCMRMSGAPTGLVSFLCGDPALPCRAFACRAPSVGVWLDFPSPAPTKFTSHARIYSTSFGYSSGGAGGASCMCFCMRASWFASISFNFDCWSGVSSWYIWL